MHSNILALINAVTLIQHVNKNGHRNTSPNIDSFIFRQTKSKPYSHVRITLMNEKNCNLVFACANNRSFHDKKTLLHCGERVKFNIDKQIKIEG